VQSEARVWDGLDSQAFVLLSVTPWARVRSLVQRDRFLSPVQLHLRQVPRPRQSQHPCDPTGTTVTWPCCI
jgi:hypothetical protein